MTKSNMNPLCPRSSGIRHAGVAALATLVICSASAQTVSQSPLSVADNVPGNLLLVPSVEWPTLDSMANLDAYVLTRAYVGYFDPDKCYKYSYNAVETERHFYPVRTTSDHECDNSNAEWSGNYLNWAATQTIDPFRKALTGGYRVRDTTSETWLEKARFDRNGGTGIYPDRRVPAGTGSGRAMVQDATPVTNWDQINTRISRLGNKMHFQRTGDFSSTTVVPYDPDVHTSFAADDTTLYEVSVRVKVCDHRTGIGVEDNCRRYPNGTWKPEGLIQQYSERLRYSVFGYLNDDDILRDGGVLRAKQKFVGENKLDPARGWIANDNREWDPDTGVQVRNPDPDDADATAVTVGNGTNNRNIADSGVINYINKFGQMTTANHKTYDPVSELFYAAIRYLKHQGNVPEYTTLSGSPDERYKLADGFPVITTWDDPMQYRCQRSALLGIGDTNTHRDKNLPGNTTAGSEPTRPTTVTGDETVNVVTATQRVAALENIAINTPFTQYENSAYMAGLAYDAHTRDLRSDFPGMQTASTYWVDVREGGILAGRATNQYWLATKYGGFTVPQGYDPAARTAALEPALWSSGENLSTGDPRPMNFYVASEADRMVESLSRAFARIASEAVGSGTSLAANSTRLEAGTRTFQAQFNAGTWSGQLQAFTVNTDGTLASSPIWRATTLLSAATWSARPIYFHDPQGNNNSRHREFTWDNLNADQKAALGTQRIVDYLRGDRSMEEARGTGLLRTRTEILGDIVNSTPVFVGAPNARLYAAASFDGATSHDDYASAQRTRTPVVYVGANDGMLHGFNANTGAETYSFVPNAVIMNSLRSYADPAYDHRYFVDGEIAVADVYDGSNWRTILVGTLGRGGPGVFALDVTNPTSVQFLWEKRGADIAALGKNIGRPVIAQVANGDWRVLIGNGVGSTGATAQLVTIGALSGTYTVGSTGVSGTNGLTAVLARDTNADSFADVAYAGDLRGNLWKFSGLSGTPSASKMFEARDPSGVAQPITAAPLAGRDPSTGTVWVFFGTGQFLGGNDALSRQVQTWYGLKDAGSGMPTRSDLVQRDILAEGTINTTGVRAIEQGTAAELDGSRGWYMDLVSPVRGAEGERMVVPNRFQGQVLIGTTRIPDASDACQPAGRGYVMAINPFTGGRLDGTFFDASRDGEFTNADMMMVNGVLTVVSGIGFGSGPSNPIFTENMMHVSLDDGSRDNMETQGSAVEAGRMSWRELVN
jgi:type IV pilus assembly protein PilY1